MMPRLSTTAAFDVADEILTLVSIFIASVVLESQYKTVTYSYSTESHRFQVDTDVELVSRLYVPKLTGLAKSLMKPLILIYSSGDDLDLDDEGQFRAIDFFAIKGYLVLHVFRRGTGQSQGMVSAQVSSSQDQSDLMKVIDQIPNKLLSHQYNGKFAIFASNVDAVTAIYAANQDPAGLAALILVSPSNINYNQSIAYRQGIFNPSVNLIQMDHDRLLPLSPTDVSHNNAPFTSKYYLNHSTHDPSWRIDTVSAYHIKVPVMIVTGLYSKTIDTTISLYESLTQLPYDPRKLNTYPSDSIIAPKVKLIIGPYSSQYPEDFSQVLSELNITNSYRPYSFYYDAYLFLQQYIMTQKTGYNHEPDVSVFIQNRPLGEISSESGQWHYQSWPIQRLRHETYYLTSDGGLYSSLNPLSSQHIQPLPDLSLNALAQESGLVWQDGININFIVASFEDMEIKTKNAGQVAFISNQLQEPVVIFGQVKVNLSLNSKPSNNIFLRLEQVQKRDSILLSTVVSTSVINGEVLYPSNNIDALFNFITWTFPKGSYIRLMLTYHAIGFVTSGRTIPPYQSMGIILNTSETNISIPVLDGAAYAHRLPYLSNQVGPQSSNHKVYPSKLVQALNSTKRTTTSSAVTLTTLSTKMAKVNDNYVMRVVQESYEMSVNTVLMMNWNVKAVTMVIKPETKTNEQLSAQSSLSLVQKLGGEFVKGVVIDQSQFEWKDFQVTKDSYLWTTNIKLEQTIQQNRVLTTPTIGRNLAFTKPQELPVSPPQGPQPAPSQETQPTPSQETQPTPSQETQPTPSQGPQPAPSQETQPAPSQGPQPTPSQETQPAPL